MVLSGGKHKIQAAIIKRHMGLFMEQYKGQ